MDGFGGMDGGFGGGYGDGGYGGGGGGGYGAAPGGAGGAYGGYGAGGMGGGMDGGYGAAAPVGGAGYGAGGAMAAGGYGAGSPGMGASQGSTGGKQFAESSITPLTVKQLLASAGDHPDNTYMVDGHALDKVILVGCMTALKTEGMGMEMTLDDGTASTVVKAWNVDPLVSAQLNEGNYVRVIGVWKSMGKVMTMVAQHTLPITDYNMVTHHMLEALYVHLYRTKGPLKDDSVTAAPTAAAAAGMGFGQAAAPPAFGATSAALPGGGMGGMGGGGFAATSSLMGTGADSGLKEIHNMVLEEFKPGMNTEKGTDMREVVKRLVAKGQTQGEIKAAVDHLASEGHLYNTIDEHHYQYTCREWS